MLSVRKNSLKFDHYKNDVFAMGLIFLECCVLGSVQTIYDYKNKKVDFEELELLLNQMNDRYPENVLLVSTIRKMLEWEMDNRPTFIEIYEKLPDYQVIKAYFLKKKQQKQVDCNKNEQIINDKNGKIRSPSPNTMRSTISKNTIKKTADTGLSYIPTYGSRSPSPIMSRRDRTPVRNVLNTVYNDTNSNMNMQ